MALEDLINKSTVAKYVRSIRAAPREVICNRRLILTSILYALSAVPATWDQGSSAVVPSLQGFQDHFHISTGTDAEKIRFFISLIYIGYGTGAMLSFFVNDRIGRRWSFRCYIVIYIIGQLIAVFANNLAALYAARVIAGLGIGALTVTGPLSIIEIAPTEIRGLLGAWFTVAMGFALFVANFCVYGIYSHIPPNKLQYQIVWFAPCIFMTFCAAASFFCCESPRWLILVDKHDLALVNLVELRGLPADHPRVQYEFNEIQTSIRKEKAEFQGDGSHFSGISGILRETFLVPSNLRRVQQTIVSYGLAQLSGANSITSYLIPILTAMGVGGDAKHKIFLSGMYAFSKLCFTLIASFFFIDALGRRKSLFIGICVQLVSDLYIGIYIKFNQEGRASYGASQGALAATFIHAFGYAVGLLTLPYVFGGELWPNRIRSFGGALSQCFHWFFIYAMQSAVPSLLSQTHNWGAFSFFAGSCALALVYVYLMVPELAGLSVEEIDELFKGPWFNAFKRSKIIHQSVTETTEGQNPDILSQKNSNDDPICIEEKVSPVERYSQNTH